MKYDLIDKELLKYINLEKKRQVNSINLIASENICPDRINKIISEPMGNKYAEGIVGNRFYSGCEFIDKIEQLAQDRCCSLFNVDYSNVQPHSGSQANLSAIFALLNKDDTILSMDFNAGGHLSHGHPLNIVSKLYNIKTYNVNRENELINYDELLKIAKETKPKLIISGASSYSRLINYKEIYNICKLVGAYHLIDIAHIAGFIACNIFENPFQYSDIITSTTHKTLRGSRGGFIVCKKEFINKINRAVMPGIQGGPLMNMITGKAMTFLYAMQPEFLNYSKLVLSNSQFLCSELQNYGFRIVSNGTDNHMFLIDIYSTHGITGQEAEIELAKNNIYVNKNCIPYDILPSRITSGIRIGTPFITSLGIELNKLKEIASNINNILFKIKKK